MRRNGRILFIIGIVFMLVLYLPCLLLGEQAIFTYHDQLDGEMIAYILQAKHLGEGGILPEFLGGASKTALIPPAPGCVLLFKVFSPFPALFIMQLTGSLIGYVGMYLLVHRITDSSVAGFVSGILYGMLPFLPVYGLAQWGLPLLVWCVPELCGTAEPQMGRRQWFAFLYGAFYALNSSPVLVGFAVMAVMGVWILRRAVRGKNVLTMRRLTMFWLTMAAIYGVTNLGLVLQMFGIGTNEISHKAEYILTPESFWGGLVTGYLQGGQHSADYHAGILILSVVIILAAGLDRSARDGKIGTTLLICAGCNFIFALIAAAWNSAAGMAIRQHLGAFGAFQMDRFLWLAPCLWYLALGCCVGYAVRKVLRLWRGDDGAIRRQGAEKKAAAIWIAAVALSVLCCVVTAYTGLRILKNSDIKSNLQKLRNPDYPVLSYSDYYALGVMDQVRDYLHIVTGMNQEEYRVVSLGIDPAAALYHGFYCLDGYSNNYSLEYKHEFRRVIAPALAESEYLRAYFDDWGNRCYLFGSECPGYYTIEKNGFYFQHLELDTAALQKLGGDYLLSAAYIANSGELGLELLTPEPFETEDSYYRIYVYRVAP